MSLLTKRTIYGSELQTALLMKSTYAIRENTTLNEKFNILEGVTPDDELPALSYYCIGRGGHKNLNGADGEPLTTLRPHQARDAALFKHMPFVMRPTTDDLDELERNKYGLRVTEVHGEVSYFCYYLKRLDLTEIVPELEYRVASDGNTTVTPFTPARSDLNPTPVDLPVGGVSVATGESLAVKGTVEVMFDVTDAEELVNVAKILYDNELYAVVSEIGLCSGVDEVVPTTPIVGSPYNLREAAAVQIATHVSCFYPLQFNNNGFRLKINLGASEPLAVTG